MSPTPQPREVNDVLIVTIGVIGWVIALLVALVIEAEERVLGICIAGIALGVWGLRYVRRRRARMNAQPSN